MALDSIEVGLAVDELKEFELAAIVVLACQSLSRVWLGELTYPDASLGRGLGRVKGLGHGSCRV